jgi:hypothetical protein
MDNDGQRLVRVALKPARLQKPLRFRPNPF